MSDGVDHDALRARERPGRGGGGPAAPEHGALPSYAFLDFMADCVIKLDQRLAAQINTRRPQVLKYRGSGFGRNEYPYVIGEDGLHITRLIRHDDLQALLQEILDAAIAITRVDFGNVQLLDRARGMLTIVVQRSFASEFLDFFNGVHDGMAACGTAMQRGHRVIVADVANDPIFKGTRAGEVMLAAGVQSTPLVGRSRALLGMFSAHYRAPRRPDERALQLLDLLARQAADLLERQLAEAALQQAHATLEQRVQEHTAALRYEMAERQRLEREAQRVAHFALLGRLAAGVSREIRNPLGAVFLHVELLWDSLLWSSLLLSPLPPFISHLLLHTTVASGARVFSRARLNTRTDLTTIDRAVPDTLSRWENDHDHAV